MYEQTPLKPSEYNIGIKLISFVYVSATKLEISGSLHEKIKHKNMFM